MLHAISLCFLIMRVGVVSFPQYVETPYTVGMSAFVPEYFEDTVQIEIVFIRMRMKLFNVV